jgi:hypothetical protein
MKALTLCSIFVFLGCRPALAETKLGGNSDGGGNAVVCRDAQDNVVSAEMLDLFEARLIHDRVPNVDPNKDYFELAREVALRIDEGGSGRDMLSLSTLREGGPGGRILERNMSFFPQVRWAWTDQDVRLAKRVMRVVPGVGLKKIMDYDSPFIPKNCKVEQLAVYQDKTERLLVAGEIWEKMDNVNRAALLVHEGVYKGHRRAGATNSDRARWMVGLAFSSYPFEWILKGIPKEHVICFTHEDNPANVIVFYGKREGVLTAQFLRLNGNVMFSLARKSFSAKVLPSFFGTKLEGPAHHEYGSSWTDDISSPVLEEPMINLSHLVRDGKVSFTMGFPQNQAYDISMEKPMTCRSQEKEIPESPVQKPVGPIL